MKQENFKNGIMICEDCMSTEVTDLLKKDKVDLILTDPPYGISIDKWDRKKENELSEFLISFLQTYSKILKENRAAYVFGGVGKFKNREFFKFLSQVEEKTDFQLANLITWGKKRAYGVRTNYIFTREEIAYLTLGNFKKPEVFNVPYLEELRGYDGYNKKYPALSPYKRRTNVWSDINEIFKGKTHPTEKPQKLLKVIIESSSNEEEVVLDAFAGTGSTALAAISLNRRFILIEKDETYFNIACERIQKFESSK